MNQSLKLSLFLGLGCKPMKDVVYHHPEWTIHCANMPIGDLDKIVLARERAAIEKEYIRFHRHQFIEAIPKKLSDDEIENNLRQIEQEGDFIP